MQFGSNHASSGVQCAGMKSTTKNQQRINREAVPAAPPQPEIYHTAAAAAAAEGCGDLHLCQQVMRQICLTAAVDLSVCRRLDANWRGQQGAAYGAPTSFNTSSAAAQLACYPNVSGGYYLHSTRSSHTPPRNVAQNNLENFQAPTICPRQGFTSGGYASAVPLLKHPVMLSLQVRDSAALLSKVHVVGGDISLPGLGLSAADRATLVSSVNFIIHCAADIRLEADIQVS